jgi:predicted ATPase
VRLREGLTAWRVTGAQALQPYFLALLAEVHAKLGQAEKGLTVIAEAFALVEEHSERFCEAELYRLKGELLLCQSPDNQAEAGSCFQEAIRTAQYQGAKSWELRAATSLARLRLSEGRQAEARQCLSEIYHWFAEGLNTFDLMDAKAVLGELDLLAAQSQTI